MAAHGCVGELSNMKQTLWIITELFPPEETSTGYIMGQIANAMTLKYNVKVICGPAVYDSSKKQNKNGESNIDDSIEVFHVEAVSENKSNKLSRMRKFLLMSWKLFRVAKNKIKSGDHVLMVTNPFPLIVLMGHLHRHRKFMMTMLVHDIMPESLYTEINIPPIVYKIASKVFNKAYTCADQLVSIGRDMTEVLQSKCRGYSHKPKISLVENWGDVENIYPEYTFEAKNITIQYAGNIGNAQGVGEFVELLHEANCNNVSFDIWGVGNAENEIKEKVKEYGMLDCVMFHGSYLRSQQQMVLNHCDMALVCLVEGMYGLGVPSKAYNILAAGKPILYIGEKGTEIWRMIRENGNGVCFEPNDKMGLQEYLRGLSLGSRTAFVEMGKISRRLAEEKYSKAAILEKYTKLV